MCMRIIAISLVLTGFLASPSLWAQSQPNGDQLTAAQWLEAMGGSGIMLDGVSDRGFVFSLLLVLSEENSGVALNVWSDRHGSNFGQHQGTWRMDGNALCTTFPTSNVNQERCARLFRQADGSYQAWLDNGNQPVWTYRTRTLK